MVKRMKKIIKIPMYVIGSFLIYVLSVFIHEMSHIIVSLGFGNPLKEIVFFNIIEDNFFTFSVGVIFNNINKDAILWVAISGSIGVILVCIPILIFAVKRRSIILTGIGFIFILKEFIYWTFGSYYNLGDPYNLLWSLENQYNITINSFNLFLFFLIITIIVYGLFIVFLFRVWILKEGLEGL